MYVLSKKRKKNSMKRVIKILKSGEGMVLWRDFCEDTKNLT